MRLFITFFTIIFALYSGEFFGVVTKVKGMPKADEIILKVGDKVYTTQTISTDSNSRLIIKQENGNIIAIGKNSILSLSDKAFVKQKKGNIFFNITKKAAIIGKYRFKIKLKTATMGIRGTNFIVKNSEKEEEVLLRKGKLEFIAQEKEFAIYKKKMMNEFSTFQNEFNEYKKNLMHEFNEYKKKENYEFSEYKKEFQISSNMMVLLDGQKAYKAKVDPKVIQAQFKEFDNFIE